LYLQFVNLWNNVYLHSFFLPPILFVFHCCWCFIFIHCCCLSMFHGYLLMPSCLLLEVNIGKQHEPPILNTFLICYCLSVPCCSLLLFVFCFVPPIFGAPHHSILCRCGRRNLNDYFKFFQIARQVCIFFLCLFVFVYLGFKKFISPT